MYVTQNIHIKKIGKMLFFHQHENYKWLLWKKGRLIFIFPILFSSLGISVISKIMQKSLTKSDKRLLKIIKLNGLRLNRKKLLTDRLIFSVRIV